MKNGVTAIYRYRTSRCVFTKKYLICFIIDKAHRMPPKKTNKGKKRVPRTSDEDDNTITTVDIHYNPDIVEGMLQDIENQTEAKCAQIKKDIDFMVTSIQQMFHLELIKIPNHVKQMSLQRFRDEFGDSLDAANRASVNQSNIGTTIKSSKNENLILQTPSSKFNVSATARHPREGEVILSKNGSPLGEFTTCVKAPRPNTVPATPGVYVPLSTGDIIDMENISSLPDDLKTDALEKMQIMMNNMQTVMNRMKKTDNKV